jgi:hypothetical protein
MRRRCRPGSRSGYAERGISICARWDSFENFLADMGERPPGKTLDRIDNNGNYEPGNCQWATLDQQNRNRRGNRLTPESVVWIREMGGQMTQQQMADILGVHRSLIFQVLNDRIWKR